MWSSYKAWQQIKFNSYKDNHLSFTNNSWTDIDEGTLIISHYFALFLFSVVVILNIQGSRLNLAVYSTIYVDSTSAQKHIGDARPCLVVMNIINVWEIAILVAWF